MFVNKVLDLIQKNNISASCRMTYVVCLASEIETKLYCHILKLLFLNSQTIFTALSDSVSTSRRTGVTALIDSFKMLPGRRQHLTKDVETWENRDVKLALKG